MNKITVIIPFLNEGEEIYSTVSNIRETAGDKVDIILIDDASRKDYNYELVAEQFDATFIRHEERKGVAASRDEAVENCLTEFFLLLDGHMRFFQKDWVELIMNELEENRRALFCCQSLALEKGNDGCVCFSMNKAETYGAYMDFGVMGDLQVKWNIYDPNPNFSTVEIPCILGAGYACNRTYWRYLRGLEGLRSYGMDEQFISLKVWMEGGVCKLIKNVKIGHFYRSVFPYKTENIDLLYNKIYIAELLLPYKEKYNIFKNWSVLYDSLLKEAIVLLAENKEFLNDQKKYLQKIFTNNIETIISNNMYVQEKNYL